jgi:hypothetical protein
MRLLLLLAAAAPAIIYPQWPRLALTWNYPGPPYPAFEIQRADLVVPPPYLVSTTIVTRVQMAHTYYFTNLVQVPVSDPSYPSTNWQRYALIATNFILLDTTNQAGCFRVRVADATLGISDWGTTR